MKSNGELNRLPTELSIFLSCFKVDTGIYFGLRTELMTCGIELWKLLLYQSIFSSVDQDVNNETGHDRDDVEIVEKSASESTGDVDLDSSVISQNLPDKDVDMDASVASQSPADKEKTAVSANDDMDVSEALENNDNNSTRDDLDASTVSVNDKEGDASAEPAVKDTPSKVKKIEDKLKITPKKVLSPKQIQKKLESEKKRAEKQKEKEEKERLKNEEKERLKQEKLKQKQEKDEQKKKEKEMKEQEKLKKIEEKEQKKKQKEEEKEQEKIKKQQELEEKNKEKIKQEELKQKTASAFVNFFAKKDTPVDTKKSEEAASVFKPFEIKSDMRLPKLRREPLSESDKHNLIQLLENPDESRSYLKDLKAGKTIGKSEKTWPVEDEGNDDDVVVLEEESNLGESICEDKPKAAIMKAKYLKFHENRRPAYHGTWRKKSAFISGRKPFGTDNNMFDYEVDSDDDWEEEEEQGESIAGSDDEEKENEPEDDYEVDNEFFVPHGHLSDDEVDDEEASKLSPEDLKQKLKLLKDEFDQDMQSKTHKLKPRSIGCVWFNKDGTCDEEAIEKYLKPLKMITNGQIIIKSRALLDLVTTTNKKKQALQDLDPEVIKMFIKFIHGNTNKKRVLVEEFLTYIGNENCNVEVRKGSLYKHLNLLATWKKCTEEGLLRNKHCWMVGQDVQKKYKVELKIVEKMDSS